MAENTDITTGSPDESSENMGNIGGNMSSIAPPGPTMSDDSFTADYMTDRSLNGIDNQRLMGLIRQHKILYECSNSHDQRAKDAKDEAWRQIAISFGGDIPVWELTRRYKNVRTAFGRFLRRSIKRQDGSIRTLEKSTWGFLAWLKPYIKHKFDYDEENYGSISDNKGTVGANQQQPPSFAVFHNSATRSPQQHASNPTPYIVRNDNEIEFVDNDSNSNGVEYISTNTHQQGATYTRISTTPPQTQQQHPTFQITSYGSAAKAPSRTYAPADPQPQQIVVENHQTRQPTQSFIELPSSSTIRRKRPLENAEEACPSSTATSRQKNNHVSHDEDEDILFLRSLGPQMRRIPSRQKFSIKSKIMKILHDAEFGENS